MTDAHSHDTAELRRPRAGDAMKVAALLWAMVAVIFYVALKNAPVNAVGVEVFVTYEGDARMQFLGPASAEMLTAAFDGVGGLRGVPPVSSDAGPALTEEEARAAAGMYGSSHFVLGSVTLDEDDVTLSVTLHEVMGNRSRLVSASGPLGSFAGLVDDVAEALAARLHGTGGASARKADDTFSASLPALEAFFRAERSYEAGRFAQAGSLYNRALREDPDFALAQYRLSLTAAHMDRYAPARAASAAAARGAGTLGARHALLVQAREAWMDARPGDAEDLLRGLAFAHPEDAVAWSGLSELLSHNASFNAAPANVSEEATRRLLGLDPGHAEGLIQAARIAAGSGSPTRLRALADQARASSTEPTVVLALEAAVEAMAGPLSRGMTQQLSAAPEGAARAAAGILAAGAQDMEAALAVVQTLTDPHRTGGVRALGEVWTAYLYLAQGKRGPATEAFDRAAALDPDLATEHQALAFTLSFLHWSDADVALMARRMARWRPGGARANAAPEPHYQMHLQSRLLLAPYLAGRLALTTGDTAAARLWSLEVRTSPWTPENPPLPQAFAASLEAELERAADDGNAPTDGAAEAALDTLMAAYQGMSYQLRQPSLFLSLARERWLAAELLAELGRDEEAARWFEPYWGLVTESVFLAPSLYRRAQLRDAAGDAQGALDDYRRFLDLWSDADAELSAWTESARARMAALQD